MRASVRVPASRLVARAARLIPEQHRLRRQHRLERRGEGGGVAGAQSERYETRGEAVRQPPPAAVPARDLSLAAGRGVRGGRADLRFRGKLDPGAVKHPAHVLFAILGVGERAPRRTEQKAAGEGHAGSRQPAGQPQTIAT